jgi:hypothetical protein
MANHIKITGERQFYDGEYLQPKFLSAFIKE